MSVASNINPNPIITLENISLSFPTKNGNRQVLEDLSLSINEGEVLGLVGASGCGKTTLGRMLMGLEKASEGRYLFAGVPVETKADLRRVRQKMQMVFQDAFLSLDPTMRMEQVLLEPIRYLRPTWTDAERKEKIAQTLDVVGLDPRFLRARSREMSGGQRQRIGIARALIVDPEVLICDESVSALDISIQAQILNLLLEIREKLGITILFISHDFAVVNYVADTIAVMKDGKIEEKGPAGTFFQTSRNPYTRMLMDAVLE